MSTAQILEEVRTLSTSEIQLLAVSLQAERLRRVGKTASDEETRWLEIINQPLVQADRLATLSAQWEDNGLSEDERAEMLGILSAREAQNAQRAEAVQRLSELTEVPFLTLWQQLVGEPPALLVPRN